MGFVGLADQPAEEDGALVAALRNAGAVLYCKTNVPTGLMLAEYVPHWNIHGCFVLLIIGKNVQ